MKSGFIAVFALCAQAFYLAAAEPPHPFERMAELSWLRDKAIDIVVPLECRTQETANTRQCLDKASEAVESNSARNSARNNEIIASLSADGVDVAMPTFVEKNCGSLNVDCLEKLAKVHADLMSANRPAINTRDQIVGALWFMTFVDQEARKYKGCVTDPDPLACRLMQGGVIGKIDALNTNILKNFVTRFGWIDSSWGRNAASHAWLIIQHADRDPDFQDMVLSKYMKMETLKGPDRRHAAYLTDRVAHHKNLPQTYGTQGSCLLEEGKPVWRANPLKDPANIDKIRASAGLPPMRDYQAITDQMCQVKVIPAALKL